MTKLVSLGRSFACAVVVGCLLAALSWSRDVRAESDRTPETSGLARYPIDAQEFARLSAERPRVAELINEGERFAIAGDPARALSVFNRAAEEYPYSGLVIRRRCEALTALGNRADAITACLEALQVGPSPLTARATVRAFLAGPAPPTANELAKALTVVGAERRKLPDEPWAYAALCEVAERIGDEVMLEYCSGELLRIAPDDPVGRRVLAELSPPWWVGVAWLAIGLAAAATAFHALWRAALRLRPRVRPTAIAGLVLLAGSLAATSARAEAAPIPSAGAPSPSSAEAIARQRADDLKPFAIADDDPESNIPNEAVRNRNPMEFGYWLQEIASRALKASKAGDHARAVKYFKTLAKAVPDRATAFSYLCKEYDQLGQRDEAIVSCATALLRPGVLYDDYARYVHLVLGRPGSLADKDVATLMDVVDHVRKDPSGGDGPAAGLECDIGVKWQDAATLQRCTEVLDRLAPDDPKTLTYKWSLAMVKSRYGEAQQLVDRAKTSAVKPENIVQMEKETLHARLKHGLTLALGSAALALAILAAAFAAIRRRPVVPAPTPTTHA